MTQPTDVQGEHLRAALSLAASGVPVLPLRAGKVPFGNCRHCADNACGGRPNMKTPGPCTCTSPCHAWAAATTDPHILTSTAWAPAWRQAAIPSRSRSGLRLRQRRRPSRAEGTVGHAGYTPAPPDVGTRHERPRPPPSAGGKTCAAGARTASPSGSSSVGRRSSSRVTVMLKGPADARPYGAL